MSSTYHLVSDPTVKRPAWANWREKIPKKVNNKTWLLIGVGGAALIFLSLFAISELTLSDGVAQKASHSSPADEQHVLYPEDTPIAKDAVGAYLHLLIPASRPDRDLGKNLLSATILGYPTPNLINWGLTFNDSKMIDGGTHLAKISGFLRFLHSLDDTRPDDLVLMVDGYDVWFQLRPQVLLERFFAINKAADARAAELYGDAREGKNIKQKIIISSEKRCFGFSSKDAACWAVPQSPLPDDIYGPETDTLTPDGDYRHMRQRYVNSGVILGTVSALRKIFNRAKVLAEKDRNYGSDQHILAIILGEQEVWRKDAGRTHRTEGELEEDYFKDEYGLGVDYESRLSQPTVNAEMDTWWITHSRPWTIEEAKRELNITPSNNNLYDLDADVAASKPPFSLLTDAQLASPGPADFVEQHRNRSWYDVSLFTNAWTGVSPAIVHHNGDKSARWRMWPIVWYQRSARELLAAAQERRPYAPLAYVEGKHWWPSGVKNVGGARVEHEGKEWMDVGWDTVCDADCSKEVFRDKESGWP